MSELGGLLALSIPSAGATALLLSLRLLPVVLVVPIFGGMRVPSVVRLGVLGALLLATWPETLPLVPRGAAMFAAGASQLVLGLATAAAVLALVEILRMLGSLSDVALGRGSFGAGDPLQAAPEGPLGQLHALLLVVIVFLTDAHLVLIEALRRGVQRFGPTEQLDVAAIDGLGRELVAVLQTATETAVALAMPAMMAALLVDLMLGWVQRVLPQIPASFLAMPLRQLLGWTLVAAVAASAPSWVVPLLAPAVDSVLQATEPGP